MPMYTYCRDYCQAPLHTTPKGEVIMTEKKQSKGLEASDKRTNPHVHLCICFLCNYIFGDDDIVAY